MQPTTAQELKDAIDRFDKLDKPVVYDGDMLLTLMESYLESRPATDGMSYFTRKKGE